jgi:futalosine hydrolase
MLKISAKVTAKDENMERICEICAMRILLIAATKFEIEPFIADNKAVEVLITGVGSPSTMYHLQKKLQQKETDFVIQAGIAGAFKNDMNLGDVMLVMQDVFADIGMEEKEDFKPIFDVGFADKNEFPYNQGWLVNPTKLIPHLTLPVVKAVTVNKVSDSQLQKKQITKRFAPEIETMEGAACHYVCLQENIPFIQLRSISNYVGERDKSKWKMKEAIVNLNTAITELVNTVLLRQ